MKELSLENVKVEFPSPTGVNHYEYSYNDWLLENNYCDGFRPQQGLTIMNERM